MIKKVKIIITTLSRALVVASKIDSGIATDFDRQEFNLIIEDTITQLKQIQNDK